MTDTASPAFASGCSSPSTSPLPALTTFPLAAAAVQPMLPPASLASTVTKPLGDVLPSPATAVVAARDEPVAAAVVGGVPASSPLTPGSAAEAPAPGAGVQGGLQPSRRDAR